MKSIEQAFGGYQSSLTPSNSFSYTWFSHQDVYPWKHARPGLTAL